MKKTRFFMAFLLIVTLLAFTGCANDNGADVTPNDNNGNGVMDDVEDGVNDVKDDVKNGVDDMNNGMDNNGMNNNGMDNNNTTNGGMNNNVNGVAE